MAQQYQKQQKMLTYTIPKDCARSFRSNQYPHSLIYLG